MVAAAGGEGGVNPGLAVACLVVIVVGILAGLYRGHDRSLYRHFALEKPPGALRVEARAILAETGHEIPRGDSAQGLSVGKDYFDWVEDQETVAGSWETIGEVLPSPFGYWYRESPRKLIPTNLFKTAISDDHPSLNEQGMSLVRLDTTGRLTHLEIVPPVHDAEPHPAATPDWTPLFARAGLEFQAFEPASPEWNPTITSDSRMAWTGVYSDQPDLPIRVEAGSYRGKANYFTIVPPWKRSEPPVKALGQTFSTAILVTLLFGILVSGVLLARRNMRLGRGDRRGAFRMASFTFVVFVVSWIIGGDHVADFAEVGLLLDRMAWGLLFAGMVWTVYVAVEPHARRLWPDLLIAWTRLLAGRYRDPLVGRSILAGGVCMVGVVLVEELARLASRALGMAPDSPHWNGGALAVMEGTRQAVKQFIAHFFGVAIFPLGLLFLLLLFRVLLRRQWAASAAFIIVMASPGILGAESDLVFTAVMNLIIWSIIAFVLIRFGLLSLVAWITFGVVFNFPSTADVSVWFAGHTLMALLFVLALACYGFWIALAGRPLFARDLLQDQLQAPR